MKQKNYCPKIGLISAPFSKGQPRSGTELGPQAILDEGLIEQLKKLGRAIEDHTILELENFDQNPEKIHGIQNPTAVYEAVQKTAEAVARQLREGRLALTLGGDHSLALGTVLGNASVNKDLCVLWIDAHADINTVQSTQTGHLHGMPISFLLKEISSQYNRPNASLPRFDTKTKSMQSYAYENTTTATK